MVVTLPITRVTVHPDGALVVREGRVPASSGGITVGGLPLLLEGSSLRARVTGATLHGTRLDLDLPVEHRATATQAERDLVETTRELAVVKAEVRALKTQRQVASGLALAFDAEGAPLTASALEGWTALETSVAPWLEDLDRQLVAMRRRQEELEGECRRRQVVLEDQSTEALWRRWAPTHQVHLAFDGDGDVEIELSYIVEGARWTPAYAVDLDEDLRSGTLTMRALLAQASGEDWTDAALSVTTAPCRRVADVPVLSALRLGVAQPRPRSGWRPLPADFEALFGTDTSPQQVEPERVRQEVELAFFDEDDEVGEPPIQRSAAPPMPMAMPEGGVRLAGGGGPPVGAPSPVRARKKKSFDKSKAKIGKAFGKRRPALAEVKDRQMAYPDLVLEGARAGRGRRGRLVALDPAQRLLRRGLPPAAAERWSHALKRLLKGANDLLRLPMPPHHVLPGPIEGRDVVVDAPGAVSVPSDGRFHAVSLFREPVELEVHYRAVPRLDPRVFRRVEAHLERDGALLAGPMEVLIGGALELVAPFAGAAGDGALTFGLGPEDRLSVARNVRYSETSAGLLGGSRRHLTTVTVEVASGLPDPVRIELLERVPVAAKEGYPSIEIAEHQPRSEAWGGDPDGPELEGARVQWLDVRPGAKGTAVLGYAVTLGNREQLVGGDRRG